MSRNTFMADLWMISQETVKVYRIFMQISVEIDVRLS